jgi:murein DD-endopeptidase MepM/ murein hydrolase activator NlpD
LNIILVSGRSAAARTISLTGRQLAGACVGVLLAIIVLTSIPVLLIQRYTPDLSFLQERNVASQHSRQHNESYMRDNLNAMARRLGEMQAQLLRLDNLGERLAKQAGFKPQEFEFTEPPGRGGAPSSVPSRDLSLGDLSAQVDLMTRQVDDRGDKLSVLESLLTLESARMKLIPTMMPVLGGAYNSNYGWRIDPFTGRQSLHEGIDFAGGEGAPILAAAGGIVVYAEHHPQYGNMVEVEHGNDLITRYAHASRMNVKVGDMVLRGAKIAEVGRTGRATGAHLHFEVLQRGVAVNPAQFLQLPR